MWKTILKFQYIDVFLLLSLIKQFQIDGNYEFFPKTLNNIAKNTIQNVMGTVFLWEQLYIWARVTIDGVQKVIISKFTKLISH